MEMTIESVKKARNEALKYLANRARCCEEVRQHLRKKGFEEEDIEQVIAQFIQCKYLNDANYVAMYLRYALGKKKALYRIKRELEQKGINSFDIEDGIYLFEDENQEEIREIEMRNAYAEADKYLGKFEGEEIDKKQLDKLARRLNTLGYSSGVITGILGEYR